MRFWKIESKNIIVAFTCLAAAAAAGTFEGCAASNDSPTAVPTTQAADGDERPSARGRTQIWAQNCMRCHNARSPDYYSDAEWSVAMHHMRVRAYMTKDEYESVLEFLKAAN